MKPTHILVRTKDKKTGIMSPVIQSYESIEFAQRQYIKNMLFGNYSTDILLFKIGQERQEIVLPDNVVKKLEQGEKVNSTDKISTFTDTELLPLEDITPYSDIEVVQDFYSKYADIFSEVKNVNQ